MATAWRLLTWTLVSAVSVGNLPGYAFQSQEEFLSSLDHYEIAFPVQVDQNGDFLTFDVKSPRKQRARRGTGGPSHEPPREQQVFYRVSAHRAQFLLNLTLHTNLLAERFRVEYWRHDGVDRKHEFHEDCHYSGHLQDEYLNSKVAISNCNGLPPNSNDAVPANEAQLKICRHGGNCAQICKNNTQGCIISGKLHIRETHRWEANEC